MGNGFSKCLIFQLIESICGTYLSGSDISVLPEAIFMFDPGSASSVETTQASHSGGEGLNWATFKVGRARGPEQLTQT